MTRHATDLHLGQIWPSREEFHELARNRRLIPVARKVLAPDITPVGLYRHLCASKPGTYLFESAEHDGRWGRWSFIGVDSASSVITRDGVTSWQEVCPGGAMETGSFREVMHSALEVLRADPIEGLPPLTGAFVGSIGWAMAREWEPSITMSAPREMDVPDASLILARDVAAIDHSDGSLWLVSNAWNMDGTDERVDWAYDEACRRVGDMCHRLESSMNPAVWVSVSPSSDDLAIQHRTPQDDFEQSVRDAKEAIGRGDAFQIVLSQRMDVSTQADALDVYSVLRTLNPSPYLYLLRLPDGVGGDFDVVGSSPETLVRTQGQRVWTYPIAGSRPRGANGSEDHDLAVDLLKDPKELAEHAMLVDLARNDLSRVCRPESVEVSTLMEIKRYSHIQHISSTVTGIVNEGVDALDCLVATFPAGTLSGAPKTRAIQLIDELEPCARGVYGGVVGYFDLGGDTDFAIAIRTACLKDGRASVQAGAGIVADSVEHTEYVETHNKAAAALASVLTAAKLTGDLD